ncbi:leucine-rich repeat domain-containing protein [Ruminococcus sp.]|uniref:leucine-rich repeat domain-containing protein n=1 Tax=Ruminococcus sp. TaxID=41978 RepID=UPI0025FBDC58|nr:leucine-rich repeat domain-containing protein [Ruminococcus sp.]MBQ8967610.1 leucine-rich repeat domain-containing protein [Ruminococcus sp.]
MKGRLWRKALAAALALLVVSGNVPIRPVADLFGGTAITASAEGSETSGQCGDNAYWLLDSGKLTISGTGAMYDYEYDDDTETVNSPWFAYKDNITSVEFENGITSIGNSAFDSCAYLTSITIPDSVERIGDNAFFICSGLTSITIPDSVKSIGDEAFRGCTGLTSITIPDGVTSIGDYAFYSCTSLKSVTIPDSVTSIGLQTFAGCESLETVTIPDSVTGIGEGAFAFCAGLTSIEIPDSVESIGANAFYDCTNITDVYCDADPEKLTWDDGECDDFKLDGSTVCHVPGKYYWQYVKKFGAVSGNPVNVTFDTEALHGQCGENATWELELDSGKLTISGEGAMYDYEYDDDTDTVNSPWFAYRDNITSVEIESGITSIGDSAFDSCANLPSVSIPDSVKSIGVFAFYGCTGLTSITIPDSVKSIGVQAFQECARLESAVIGNSVESIGNSAFAFCEGLTSIEIPDSVTNIGADAFYDCTNINYVYCDADPKNLTWDEYGCNDFIYDEENASDVHYTTVCYVPAKYYLEYVKKFGAESENPVNVTFYTEAPHGQCGESAYWLFDSDTGKLTISGTGAMYHYSSNDQPWYKCRDNITSVEIEYGVTSIGDYAFEGYTSLESITIPDSVTSIGRDAFRNCESITDVYCYAVPKNLTWDDGGCDDFKPGKETICHVPEEHIGYYNSYFGSRVNVTFQAEKMGKCGENAYWLFDSGKLTISGTGDMYDYEYGTQPWYTYQNNIISVEIEKGITSIGNSAFMGCESLTSITIPEKVTSIGDFAFASCTSLTSIEIPDSVTNIGANAFFDCTNIKDVYCYADPANLTWDEYYCDDFKEDGSTVCHVPAKYYLGYVKKFGAESETPVNVTFDTDAPHGQCGENAYWLLDSGKLTISGTGNMDVYEYDNATETVNSPWFAYKDNITSVEFENGITSIGNYAFFICTGLTSITISNSVINIGDLAFEGCTRLESAVIGNSVESIGNSAFYKCKGLTSIKIPDSVTSIGADAFCSCTGLTSITIPDSVESIGNYAFAECENLTSVEISKNITSISEGTFYGCTGLTSIKIPDSVKSIGNNAFDGCEGLTSIEIPDSVTSISEGTFSGCTDLTSIKIPDNVESIGNSAFQDCRGLTSIKIPDNVESIGNSAFQDCTGLTSIKIPDSVTSIGGYVFNHCTSLTSVEISKNVTSIGDGTFFGCTDLTSIKIPDSVESIGNDAFFNCTSLTSITIPDSVESIGKEAFYDCTNITDVYCYANPEDLTWDEGSCDDFIYDSENAPDVRHTTICHVPAEYLEDYEAKFGASGETPVNVRFVGDVDMGLGEHLYGYSITLDGSIGVNFYVELTDELLASETAEMVFTVPNGSKTDTQNLLVKDVIAKSSNKVVIGSKTYYKFKCSVTAKDMASEITAQLVDGENSGEKYTYSVKDYADYLIEHTEVEQYEKAAPLVKAMLNYGAYSQEYFGEGTPLADSYKAAVDDVSVPVKFEYDDNAKLPEGVTFEGATLSLKSETTLSLYFKGLPEGTTFTCNGKTVETAKNGKYVVARIRGIKASELENDFTVTFKDGSVTYNAMTYCYNVLNGGSGDEKLQNVCKALYLYAEEANKYFGGNN